MPDITLSLTTPQADKALAAIGMVIHTDNAKPDFQKPASPAEAREWVFIQLRMLVRQYDRKQTAPNAEEAAKATSLAAGW